jgi:hypothetical protein
VLTNASSPSSRPFNGAAAPSGHRLVDLALEPNGRLLSFFD